MGRTDSLVVVCNVAQFCTRLYAGGLRSCVPDHHVLVEEHKCQTLVNNYQGKAIILLPDFLFDSPVLPLESPTGICL